MRLNSVIFADDSSSCDIADLCVLLKNYTMILLQQYAISHDNVELNNSIYMSNFISKYDISEKMSVVNNDSFMCFWYGHGKEGCFRMDNEDIITEVDNSYIFSNALIYTFSCYNGKDLADVLLENGAKVFVGYIGPANCPYFCDEITNEIVMSFIVSFLEGKTINEAKEDLKDAYEQAIFNEDLDPIHRALYQETRDNLVVKGDGNLCIDDIMIIS
mgnify:CR=1 FL=1